MEDGYCVKWEKHHNAIVSVFDNLYKHNILVDCTLAAENRFIKAHRIVLMACSPYFEDILSQHSENYPIVWMNMKFSELQALIDFCYRGEVRLPQAELPGFLNAARLLHIKGLCESSESYRKRRHTDSASGNSKKKYRPNRDSDGLVNSITPGGDNLDESAMQDGDMEEGNADDSQPIIQTNGGDTMLHVPGEENSDRSDLDTDEESSTGEEKDSIMLDDLIRGSGVAQYLYRWTCSKCGEAFATRAVYTDHKKTCTADPAIEHPWRCHKCPNTYKNKKDLVRHLLYCGTETERHICDRCGSTYKYERGLKRHKIYCGTDVKPMVCNACGKTYKYKRGLRRHQKQQCGLVESYMETPKRKTSDAGVNEQSTAPKSVSNTPKSGSAASKTAVSKITSAVSRTGSPHKVQSPPKQAQVTANTSIIKEADEDSDANSSMLKDGNAPAICNTCGKAYKYRKSYLNHVINCVMDAHAESKSENKENNDTNKSDSNEKESAESPSKKVLIKVEVHSSESAKDDVEEAENYEEEVPQPDDEEVTPEEVTPEKVTPEEVTPEEVIPEKMIKIEPESKTAAEEEGEEQENNNTHEQTALDNESEVAEETSST